MFLEKRNKTYKVFRGEKETYLNADTTSGISVDVADSSVKKLNVTLNDKDKFQVDITKYVSSVPKPNTKNALPLDYTLEYDGYALDLDFLHESIEIKDNPNTNVVMINGKKATRNAKKFFDLASDTQYLIDDVGRPIVQKAVSMIDSSWMSYVGLTSKGSLLLIKNKKIKALMLNYEARDITVVFHYATYDIATSRTIIKYREASGTIISTEIDTQTKQTKLSVVYPDLYTAYKKAYSHLLSLSSLVTLGNINLMFLENGKAKRLFQVRSSDNTISFVLDTGIKLTTRDFLTQMLVSALKGNWRMFYAGQINDIGSFIKYTNLAKQYPNIENIYQFNNMNLKYDFPLGEWNNRAFVEFARASNITQIANLYKQKTSYRILDTTDYARQYKIKPFDIYLLDLGLWGTTITYLLFGSWMNLDVWRADIGVKKILTILRDEQEYIQGYTKSFLNYFDEIKFKYYNNAPHRRTIDKIKNPSEKKEYKYGFITITPDGETNIEVPSDNNLLDGDIIYLLDFPDPNNKSSKIKNLKAPWLKNQVLLNVFYTYTQFNKIQVANLLAGLHGQYLAVHNLVREINTKDVYSTDFSYQSLFLLYARNPKITQLFFQIDGQTAYTFFKYDKATQKLGLHKENTEKFPSNLKGYLEKLLNKFNPIMAKLLKTRLNGYYVFASNAHILQESDKKGHFQEAEGLDFQHAVYSAFIAYLQNHKKPYVDEHNYIKIDQPSFESQIYVLLKETLYGKNSWEHRHLIKDWNQNWKDKLLVGADTIDIKQMSATPHSQNEPYSLVRIWTAGFVSNLSLKELTAGKITSDATKTKITFAGSGLVKMVSGGAYDNIYHNNIYLHDIYDEFGRLKVVGDPAMTFDGKEITIYRATITGIYINKRYYPIVQGIDIDFKDALPELTLTGKEHSSETNYVIDKGYDNKHIIAHTPYNYDIRVLRTVAHMNNSAVLVNETSGLPYKYWYAD